MTVVMPPGLFSVYGGTKYPHCNCNCRPTCIVAVLSLAVHYCSSARSPCNRTAFLCVVECCAVTVLNLTSDEQTLLLKVDQHGFLTQFSQMLSVQGRVES